TRERAERCLARRIGTRWSGHARARFRLAAPQAVAVAAEWAPGAGAASGPSVGPGAGEESRVDRVRLAGVRVGVVGLGRMGHFYAETVAALGTQTVLAAVVDPKVSVRSVVQSKLGIEHACGEVGAALEQAQLDAVIVATPTSAHGEVV